METLGRYRRLFVVLVGVTTLALAVITATPVSAQQSSIVLKNSNATLSQCNDTAWTLSKTGVLVDHTVTWTVTATKGATTDAFITVDGFVSVTNGGGAPATIGNIVVNLQKGAAKHWVSAAANVADSNAGDAATSAHIVASASQELPNNYDYTVSGDVGTFTETAASGTIVFTDADNNTVWAIRPQQSIPPAATVNLFFQAKFDNTILGIPAGASVRAEVIVTFGNAGARGGSGASAKNVDINGDGVLEPDEARVRSVPTRITIGVPALEECNKTVTLTDVAANITAAGTVTFSNLQTNITDSQDISDSATYFISVDVDGGTDGGSITNCARVKGADSFVHLQIGTDPVTLLPILHDFQACVGVDQGACSTVTVAPNPKIIKTGDFTTFTQGGWGAKPNGNNPGQLLHVNFATVYPGGVEVGIVGDGGSSMTFKDGTVTTCKTDPKTKTQTCTQVTITGDQAIEAYLPAGGTAGKLSADLINPTSTSAGVFGGQVLALRLNVDFSKAGITQGPGGPVGYLILHDTGTSLDGQAVAAILAAAETALGGGALPDGFTYATLNDLVTSLNEAFDNGELSTWMQQHLSLP